jgi:hypothetical protein
MHNSIEFRVLLRSASEPWLSVELARFSGVEGEKAAYKFAADFKGFDNATVDVVCSQCL